MVAHACNQALGKKRQEDHRLKASLGYIERPCLKKILKKK
jgi:hypothetical protein